MAYKGKSKYSNLGSNIRVLRKCNGLTQIDLAKILEVTNQSISAWESSKADPQQYYLEKMARYFKISTDSLLFAEITGVNNKGELEYGNEYDYDEYNFDFPEYSYSEEISNPNRIRFIRMIASACKFLKSSDLIDFLALSRSLAVKTLYLEGYTDDEARELLSKETFYWCTKTSEEK